MAATPPSTPDPKPDPARHKLHDGPWWLYPALLVAAIGLTALIARKTDHPQSVVEVSEAEAEWTPAPQPEGETVSLEIDFGNGARRQFDALPWREGMTVGDLLESARDFRPPIRYEQQGDGAEAFLESLEGVVGGGAGRRNWLYQVNGDHANESFGVRQLEPGDVVLWRYDLRE